MLFGEFRTTPLRGLLIEKFSPRTIQGLSETREHFYSGIRSSSLNTLKLSAIYSCAGRKLLLRQVELHSKPVDVSPKNLPRTKCHCFLKASHFSIFGRFFNSKHQVRKTKFQRSHQSMANNHCWVSFAAFEMIDHRPADARKLGKLVLRDTFPLASQPQGVRERERKLL